MFTKNVCTIFDTENLFDCKDISLHVRLINKEKERHPKPNKTRQHFHWLAAEVQFARSSVIFTQRFQI